MAILAKDWLQSAVAFADYCTEQRKQSNVKNLTSSVSALPQGVPDEELQKLTKLGLLSAPLPEEFSGASLGKDKERSLLMLQLLKQIGRGDLAIGRLYEGHVNAWQLIETFGSPEQIAYYAKEIRDNNHFFGVWNTAANLELDVYAEPIKNINSDQAVYRLKGKKTFGSGAGFITRMLITVHLSDSSLTQMCIVGLDQIGKDKINRDWWKPLGMEASASYEVDFSGIEISKGSFIGQPGDYQRTPWFQAGAMRFVAVQLGGAEAIYDATRQFLIHYSKSNQLPLQQARMTQMAIGIETGNLWLSKAAEMWASLPKHSEQVIAYTASLRVVAEQICQDIICESQRAIGARGLLKQYAIEGLIRNLTMYLRQPAPDAAVLHVGQYVLENFIPAFNQWNLP